MSIRIFIADDHPIILYGLRQLINSREAGIELIGCFENGTTLLDGLQDMQPDVLLLDINMPGMNGFALTKEITLRHPGVKIIALTNNEDIESVRYMISEGALGYLLKTSDYTTIVDAVKIVFKGGQYIDDALRTRLIQYSLHEERTSSALKLTRREKEILKLIATNCTSQEIADKLFVSKRTVDNHRFNLLAKLDVKNAPALVKKAMELRLLD